MLSKGYRNKFTKLKKAKRNKASSNKWLQRQLNDPYVVRSKLDNYRSRSAYKLLDINEKFNLLKPGLTIIDLGCAPGGWSQVASSLTKSENEFPKIIGIDLLPIDPIPGVIALQKDFFDADIKDTIIELLQTNEGVDIVMSDMAANTTGHKMTDHLRIISLCEEAYELAINILKPGGHFIAKIFLGGSENILLSKIKLRFKTVKHFKPKSSRKDSSELYLIALNFK